MNLCTTFRKGTWQMSGALPPFPRFYPANSKNELWLQNSVWSAFWWASRHQLWDKIFYELAFCELKANLHKNDMKQQTLLVQTAFTIIGNLKAKPLRFPTTWCCWDILSLLCSAYWLSTLVDKTFRIWISNFKMISIGNIFVTKHDSLYYEKMQAFVDRLKTAALKMSINTNSADRPQVALSG